MTHSHDIRLSGAAVQGDHIAARALAKLLDALVDGASRVLCYRLQGRSTGKLPVWVRQAARFDVVLSGLPGLLHLQGRALRDALPDRFRQGDLFEAVNPDKSALDLFEDGLEDALLGNRDSELFDEGLVETFAALRKVLNEGVQGLEILNGRTVSVSAEGLGRVEELKRSTPRPAQVRVAGTLNAIRYSDRMFTLVLEGGAQLRGVAEGVDEAKLKSLWGKPAIVSGLAHFRASGTLARIDAEQVAGASARDLELWQALPQPNTHAPLASSVLRQPQGRRTGINAIFGQWPGDESDEVVREALEELS